MEKRRKERLVIRVKKDRNYAVMSNYHFKDKKLSLRAKGLLSLMLSLPDNWDYSINGLGSICKESREIIRKTLQELKDNHYLEMKECHDENGRFFYDYIIYEVLMFIHSSIFGIWIFRIRYFRYN